MSARRVAVVYPLASPYTLPVLRLIAASDELDLTVFYARRQLAARGPQAAVADLGFRHRFLPDAGWVGVRRDVREIDFSPTLPRELERGDFELVVVSGYVQPNAILGIAWAAVRRRSYGIFSESHGLRARGPVRHRLRRGLVGPLVRGADVLFPTGRLAADELGRLGAQPAKMALFPHVPDPGVFHGGGRERDRAELRAKLGLAPEGRVVAFVGRLVESKGVETLLRAHATVHEQTGAVLVLAGTGPLRDELAAAAPAGVVFLGFQEPRDVGALLRGADLAVLPSLDEPWGTAALEAAACRCPVVATDRVASAVEVVEGHGAGVLVPAGDAGALARALTELLADGGRLAALRGRATAAAAFYTPERAAEAFLGGVRLALAGKRAR